MNVQTDLLEYSPLFPERCERDEQHATHGGVSSVLHLFPSHGPGRRCVTLPSSPHHCNAPPFFFTEFFLFFSSPFSHFLPPPLKNKIGSIKKNRHSPPVSLPDLSSPSRQSRDRPAMAIRRCAYRGRTPPTHWSTRPSSERRTW